MTVGELLQASRDAHQQYREHLPRRVASGDSTVSVAGNAEAAGTHLVAACRLRAEAHVLDPHRNDPAWADEPVTFAHDAVLDFYVAQLASVAA